MERNEVQNARAEIEFLNKTLPLETSAEIVLPDYRSEISRLLWVRPTLLPPGKFIGGGKADFSGTCCYDVLYVGPDGALYSARGEDSYSFSLPLEEDGDVELAAQVVPDAVISRVTGPRKLSVRCRMHARVKGVGSKSLSVHAVGAGNAEDMLTLCDASESGRLFVGEGDSITLEDSFLPEGGEDLRVISSRGEVFFSDVSALPDAVRCRGEVILTLLVCHDNEEHGLPYTVTRKIPFEHEIALSGLPGDARARAQGGVSELSVSVEDGAVMTRMQLGLWAQGICNESVVLCRDAFLPGRDAECRFDEVPLWQAGACANRHFSVSGELPIASIGLPVGAAVIDATADAEVGDLQNEHGHIAFSGNLRCHVLYMREGEFGVCEASLPWRTTCEGEGERIEAQASVPICRVSTVRDAVRIDAEVAISLCCTHSASERVLLEASFVPIAPIARADLEICYPAAGDNLWEVGKRYGISPDQIADANGISGEMPGSTASLSGVKYLLIPRA